MYQALCSQRSRYFCCFSRLNRWIPRQSSVLAAGKSCVQSLTKNFEALCGNSIWKLKTRRGGYVALYEYPDQVSYKLSIALRARHDFRTQQASERASERVRRGPGHCRRRRGRRAKRRPSPPFSPSPLLCLSLPKWHMAAASAAATAAPPGRHRRPLRP